MRPQSPSLLCSAWSEPKIKLSRQLFSMLFARAAELPIMTLFSFGLSNAPVFEHALLTQLALVASWVSARDVPGLRKLIAYRAARPIRWIMTHLLLGRIRKSRTPYHVAQAQKRFRGRRRTRWSGCLGSGSRTLKCEKRHDYHNGCHTDDQACKCV